VRACHPAQEVVVGVEAPGRLALGAFDLRLLQLRRDRADHARRHLILQIEDVLETAVEVIGPQMRARRRVDELRGDAYALRRLADAAFHHVAHAQFAADLLDVRGVPFVSEARIARDHEQPTHVTQCGDDVLDDAVREVLLLRVIAHVLEGQHGDRRLVRKGRTVRAASNPDEAVAAARHGNQVALPALLLVERLPERRNLDLQVVLLDDLPRPDPRQ
jgi:hypothetical protein